MTHEQVEVREKPGAKPEPDQYQTLAQFYDAIKDGKTESNPKFLVI